MGSPAQPELSSALIMTAFILGSHWLLPLEVRAPLGTFANQADDKRTSLLIVYWYFGGKFGGPKFPTFFPTTWRVQGSQAGCLGRFSRRTSEFAGDSCPPGHF